MFRFVGFVHDDDMGELWKTLATNFRVAGLETPRYFPDPKGQWGALAKGTKRRAKQQGTAVNGASEAVLAVLRQMKKPITITDLIPRAGHFSKSTVYGSLNYLKKTKRVRKLKNGWIAAKTNT